MIGISTRLMLTLALIATPALAGDDCAVPMTDWQPREAAVKLAGEQGLVLRRIRIDGGCFEGIGRDAAGRRIKLDPATLTVVEMESEDDHDDEHEDSGDD